MALLNQRQLFEAMTNTYPDVLTRSVYQPMQLSQPLFKMSLAEKRELFVAALRGMLKDIGDG
eukprot:1327012-Pyramimonas_sp.AAC.1